MGLGGRIANFKLNPVQGYAADGTATLQQPFGTFRGQALFGLMLVLTGTTNDAADITSLKVRLGGKTLMDTDGAFLRALNIYEGGYSTQAYLPIYFGDPRAQTPRGRFLGSLDFTTYQGMDLELVMELNSDPSSNAACEVRALTHAPKGLMGMGYSDIEVARTKALFRSTWNPSAAVTKDLVPVNIGSHAQARVRRVTMAHSNLTGLEVVKNGVILLQDDSPTDHQVHAREAGRVPQSGYFTWDPIAVGDANDAMATVDSSGIPHDFQFLGTTSGSDTIVNQAECLATVDKL